MADIIYDNVTKTYYSRNSPTDTYKLYTPPTATSTAPKISSTPPLSTLQSQLQDAQTRLSGIKTAQSAGYTGNDEAGATAFMSRNSTPNAPTSIRPSSIPTDNYVNPYERQYQALLGNTSGIDAAQKAIDDQNNAYRAGSQKIEDKPIEMGFIRGQQQSLENRNVNLQIPLQQRLANEQRQRQASLDAVKFELDRTDKLNADKNAATQTAADNAYRRSQATQAQANADRIFNENVREYGLDYALQKQKATVTPSTSTTSGSLSKAQVISGTNWLYNNGGTPQDIQKFQTDRGFQAWVMSQL